MGISETSTARNSEDQQTSAFRDLSRNERDFFGRMLGATYVFASVGVPRRDNALKINVAILPDRDGGLLRDSTHINISVITFGNR